MMELSERTFPCEDGKIECEKTEKTTTKRQTKAKAMEQKAVLGFLCNIVEVGMLMLTWTTRWQSHIIDDSDPCRELPMV